MTIKLLLLCRIIKFRKIHMKNKLLEIFCKTQLFCIAYTHAALSSLKNSWRNPLNNRRLSNHLQYTTNVSVPKVTETSKIYITSVTFSEARSGGGETETLQLP